MNKIFSRRICADDARDLVDLLKSLVLSCRSFSPGHLTTSNIFASYFPELPLFSFLPNNIYLWFYSTLDKTFSGSTCYIKKLNEAKCRKQFCDFLKLNQIPIMDSSFLFQED